MKYPEQFLDLNKFFFTSHKIIPSLNPTLPHTRVYTFSPFYVAKLLERRTTIFSLFPDFRFTPQFSVTQIPCNTAFKFFLRRSLVTARCHLQPLGSFQHVDLFLQLLLQHHLSWFPLSLWVDQPPFPFQACPYLAMKCSFLRPGPSSSFTLYVSPHGLSPCHSFISPALVIL